MDTKERVFENKRKGHCCSESIMNMALEDMGWPPEERIHLVKSMGAFCGGLHEGLACGTLCAAKAVLFLAEEDYITTKEGTGAELMLWFKERFGAWDCSDLLEGDMGRKLTLCPIIIEDTYKKLHEILEDIGAVEEEDKHFQP